MTRTRAMPAKGLPRLFLVLMLITCAAYLGYKISGRCGQGSRPILTRREEDLEPLLPVLSPVLAAEINRKLDPFRQRGITKEDVQRAFSLPRPDGMYLLAIINNRLYAKVPKRVAKWAAVHCCRWLGSSAHSIGSIV